MGNIVVHLNTHTHTNTSPIACFSKPDNKSASVLYNLPLSNRTIAGQCGNETDFVKVSLGDQDQLGLEFRYVANDSSRYELKFLELQINASQFANAKRKTVQHIVLL